MNVTVLEFGALGNGVTLDTSAIQSAIDAVSRSGGGRVRFPAGYTFLSGSLELKANVDLHLEEHAILLASSDYSDYSTDHALPTLTRGEVNETVLPQRAFIVGYRAHNARITGIGEINGNSDGFIKMRGEHIHTMSAPPGGRDQYLERPFTIFLVESDSVRFHDFTLRDPAFWALRVSGCDDVIFDGLRIVSDLKVPNADGIDIDRCEHVIIRDCDISTADDCISLKSCAGTAKYGDVGDVLIERCRLRSISGAITLGTESVGMIRDVEVTNCEVVNSHRGFAVRAREGGRIANVIFRDSSVQTKTYAPEWWGHGEALHVTAFAWNEPSGLGDGNPERLLPGTVSNITFRNLDVISEAGVLNWAQDDSLVSDITYDNVRMTMTPGSTWDHRIDLRPNDLVPVVTRPHNAFEVVHCRNITIKDCHVTWNSHSREDYGILLHSEVATGLTVDDLVETVVS